MRNSGSSIGYQLASVTAGGPAPLIATARAHQAAGRRPMRQGLAAVPERIVKLAPTISRRREFSIRGQIW
jgi:hypothetical protein